MTLPFKVLGGALTLFQGAENFRPAEDSFWLSALAPPPPANARVLDMGCGTGAVGLSYKLRSPHINLFGLDHDPTMLQAARRAAEANNLAFELVEAPFHDTPYTTNSFDVCLANPPFYKHDREAPPKTAARQNIRHTTNLEEWLEALLTLTKPQGSVALICHGHDAESLIKIAPQYGGSCLRHFRLKTAPHKPAKRSVLVFIKGRVAFKEIEIAVFDPQLRQQALETNTSIYE